MPSSREHGTDRTEDAVAEQATKSPRPEGGESEEEIIQRQQNEFDPFDEHPDLPNYLRNLPFPTSDAEDNSFDDDIAPNTDTSNDQHASDSNSMASQNATPLPHNSSDTASNTILPPRQTETATQTTTPNPPLIQLSRRPTPRAFDLRIRPEPALTLRRAAMLLDLEHWGWVVRTTWLTIHLRPMFVLVMGAVWLDGVGLLVRAVLALGVLVAIVKRMMGRQ